MTLPAYHFDVEQRGDHYVATATELDGVEAVAVTYDEAIASLLAKATEIANQHRRSGEPLPKPLYQHVRPL